MNNGKYNKRLIMMSGMGMLFLLFWTLEKNVFAAPKEKKRDPFVALVDSNGKIKTKDELFPSLAQKPLLTQVTLTAILWDEKRPLVLINKKVFAEGQEVARDLTVSKIYPDRVELNNGGTIVAIPLRKTEKQ